MQHASAKALMAAWRRSYAPCAANHALPATSLGVSGDSRAAADARAAWSRWHVPKVGALFDERHWPWYCVLERARVELLAGDHLPGMGLNLADTRSIAPPGSPHEALYRQARRLLAGLAIPQERPEHASRWWRRLSLRRRKQERESAAALLSPCLSAAREHLNDCQRFAETLMPLIRAYARAFADEPSEVPSGHDRRARMAQPREARDGMPQPRPGTSTTQPEESGDEYAVFSRQWDELLSAHQLAIRLPPPAGGEAPEVARLQAVRLAHRLQRQLSVARLRRWRFDQEDGQLDRRRLAALCASDEHRVFRREDPAPTPEACVCLLLDQSGSMRGLPRRLVAQAVDLAVHALEVCGVRCEVLGYTTRPGGDNPVLDAWIAAGRPALPGRLNALRHIVHKSASQPWRRCRDDFNRVMAALEGGENIDGESLHWAATRLAGRHEPRKVLVVFSDGCPFDEATVDQHGRQYLETHLRTVIAAIEASPIHLAAIGGGQDVGRFYRHALTLRQPDEVGQTLFAHLADLLTRPQKSKRKA